MTASRRKGGTSIWPVVLAGIGVVIVAIILLRLLQPSRTGIPAHAFGTGCGQAGPAFHAHQSGVWLQFSGTVTRLLADTDGSRVHQRFVVACPDGQTVLVVNDVSIGQRVPVGAGSRVAVRGQYIWNSQGGLIHFTHHALGGTESGWIAFDGRLYSLARATLF